MNPTPLSCAQRRSKLHGCRLLVQLGPPRDNLHLKEHVLPLKRPDCFKRRVLIRACYCCHALLLRAGDDSESEPNLVLTGIFCSTKAVATVAITTLRCQFLRKKCGMASNKSGNGVTWVCRSSPVSSPPVRLQLVGNNSRFTLEMLIADCILSPKMRTCAMLDRICARSTGTCL